MARHIVLAFLLTAAAPAAALAAPQQGPAPRFVGVWELQPDKQTAKNEPADYSLTRVITWDGKAITEADSTKNATIAGLRLPDAQTSVTVVTDGVERPTPGLNKIAVMPSQSVAAASWQGDNLVIRGSGQDAFGFWRFDHRLFLSPDGEQMTEITITSSSFGDSEQKSVFARKH